MYFQGQKNKACNSTKFLESKVRGIPLKKRGARIEIQPHFFYPISYEKPIKNSINTMPLIFNDYRLRMSKKIHKFQYVLKKVGEKIPISDMVLFQIMELQSKTAFE